MHPSTVLRPLWSIWPGEESDRNGQDGNVGAHVTACDRGQVTETRLTFPHTSQFRAMRRLESDRV